MEEDITSHVCFSDESHWNQGRFRSLGMVSLRMNDLECLEAELDSLLSNSDVNEFKWNKVKNAKYRIAAEKMCDFAVRHASSSILRVDVLIWDTEDSRHKVRGRDDIENIGRMYFHLFRNVLRERWPDDAVWKLHPDEHTAFDWKTLQDCLGNVSTQMDFTNPTLFNESMTLELWQEFGPASVQPVASQSQRLLQLADMFAGIAVLSHQEYSRYKEWQQYNAPPSLFSLVDESVDGASFSNSLVERLTLLGRFNTECKKRRLGVSLKSCNGLSTPDPDNPLNFWIYTPQHAEDKAPIRNTTRAIS